MTQSLSPSQYKAMTQKRGSKYGNRKTVVDDITFDSQKEANRYLVLKDMQAGGEISHLELQPRFKLFSGTRPIVYASGRQATYIADFAYFDGEKRVVEDVKSPATKTQVYKLKKACVEAQYVAIKIVEV